MDNIISFINRCWHHPKRSKIYRGLVAWVSGFRDRFLSRCHTNYLLPTSIEMVSEEI